MEARFQTQSPRRPAAPRVFSVRRMSPFLLRVA